MRKLCRIASLTEHQANLIPLSNKEDIIVIKIKDDIIAFENCCPHAKAPLNLGHEKIDSFDGSYLMCTVHGALFDKKSGRCVRGPCKGMHLNKINVEVNCGNLILAEDIDSAT